MKAADFIAIRHSHSQLPPHQRQKNQSGEKRSLFQCCFNKYRELLFLHIADLPSANYSVPQHH
ncbi:hypothetical protein ACLK1Z_15390 [Escherichia coli]